MSEDLGPAMGRGMGNTVDREQATAHGIGPTNGANRDNAAALGTDANSLKGPGYPQDELMMMPMDAAVAKPQNNNLAPGWSAMMQGMMTLVRVLPPDQYDRMMADIKAGRIDPAQLKGSTQHHNMPGMDHNSMPGMDHSKMNSQQPVDHSKMDHSNPPAVDHDKMDHSK